MLKFIKVRNDKAEIIGHIKKLSDNWTSYDLNNVILGESKSKDEAIQIVKNSKK